MFILDRQKWDSQQAQPGRVSAPGGRHGQRHGSRPQWDILAS